jgi:hypothetical protein
MAELRRSERKRTQTQFEAATETVARDAGKTRAVQGRARRAREAAVASAYEPLVGLKQLGAAGGGEGRVWVGADGSPALGGFAPTPADRVTPMRCARVPRACLGRLHKEFGTTERPNNRCSGCAGCSPVRR